MADTPWCISVVALFLSLIGKVSAGSFCWEDSYSSTTYCDSGCCGSNGHEHCCSSVSIGLIVGCVFAGICVLSVIIAVVCCCIKKKTHSGKVVSPAPGSLQPRPGPTTAGAVQTSATASHQPQPQMFYTGTQYVQQPGGYNYGYGAHHPLPPVGPPPYQPPPPPPEYSMYDNHMQGAPAPMAPYNQPAAGPNMSAPPPSAAAAPPSQPTTHYGGNFVV